MLREIKSNQRMVRQLYFVIDGAATSTSSSTTDGLDVGATEGTVQENGAGSGLYTVTFNEPGTRLLNVQVSTFTDVTSCRVVAATAQSVQIEQTGADQTTGTANGKVFLQVTLSDAADAT